MKSDMERVCERFESDFAHIFRTSDTKTLIKIGGEFRRTMPTLLYDTINQRAHRLIDEFSGDAMIAPKG